MDTRINKYLSEAGVCSRRAADRLIEEKRVTIDGVLAQTGSRVFEGAVVCVAGKPIVKDAAEPVVIAFNKPAGIVCTAQKKEKNNVIDFIGYPKRIFPVGRLDKDSEGLLLLTNDGELMNRILKASEQHEKEYVVTVDKEVTCDFLKRMEKGVPVLDRITAPCTTKKINGFSFRIILTQGLNRQIRRMCEYFGYHVVKLRRVRIMNIRLDGIKTGTYRELTKEERTKLYKAAGIL